MFTLAKPSPMGRRVPFRLRLSILDIVIPARVGKQSVIDFFIAVYPWPLNIHMCCKEMPVWFQREPHVPGSGELAVQVKGVGLHRTHLHLADVEAFRPAVRHAIHLFRPLTQTAIAREEYGDL